MLHQIVQHVLLIGIYIVRRAGRRSWVDAAQDVLVPGSELRDQILGFVLLHVRRVVGEDFLVNDVFDMRTLVVLPLDPLSPQMWKRKKFKAKDLIPKLR